MGIGGHAQTGHKVDIGEHSVDSARKVFINIPVIERYTYFRWPYDENR